MMISMYSLDKSFCTRICIKVASNDFSTILIIKTTQDGQDDQEYQDDQDNKDQDEKND